MESQHANLESTNSDTVRMSEGVQIGVYGPGENGGQRVGGRRNNWHENRNEDEINVAQRFSIISQNGLVKFQKQQQNSDVDVLGFSDDHRVVEKFQITRLYDKQFWTELHEGATDRELTLKDLCEMVLEAIKRKEEKYSLQQRKDIVLLIDTNPAGIVSTLVPLIINNLGTRVENAGFRDIWLVGVTNDQLFQLTVANSPLISTE